MIKVCYSELDGPKGLSLRLEAAGHAGYAPAGQDIVCAGASTLMQALVYLLAGEESARSDAWDEPEGPRLAVAVQAPVAPWVQGAFELAKAGFTLLAERYPDNLRFADVSRRGEQSILFLNRRGSSRELLCPQCGYVPQCPRCSVYLTYHSANGRMMCHYCGYSEKSSEACPECGGAMKHIGVGTQRAEEELHALFPEAEILRMDADTVSQGHEKILRDFQVRRVPILLGTQMVAKGLDFEDVTLVGVLGIDSLLFAQGFRAYETVFSLVTQVVGRSGRAKDPGFAIIQTTDPDNPVLTLAAAQDYDAFYEQEIAYRKLGLYPPFCGLCVIGFAGAKENEVARAAARFSALLGQQAAKQPDLPLRILGPTPGSIEKINDTYRYKLTVKCRNDRRFRDLIRETLTLYEQEKLPGKATVVVDLHSDGDI